MQGWIKDYRKEINSDVWLMPPIYHRVWQYLKYKVNHKKNKIPMRDGSFLTIRPGQHLTSVRNISDGVGWYERGIFKTPNPKTIASVLEWLVKQGMIKIERGEGNRQYTLITLSNWGSYQMDEEESNGKVTVSKQSVDINKNEENEENEKETIPYVEIVNYLNEKANKRFKPSAKKTQEIIRPRWDEGHRLKDFKKVIDVCVEKWTGTTFSNGKPGEDYLQPSTLFNDKFEERLNWSSDSEPAKQSDPRDKEIAFQRWITTNPDANPDDFYKQPNIGEVE